MSTTATARNDESRLGRENTLLGGWRPLSPERIREQRFRETALGRRGYRPDEVDSFLDRMADEVQRWTTVHAQDLDEINRLRDYYRNHPVDADSIRERALSGEAVTILAAAQQQADQLIADAKAHARAMQTDARAQAECIVAEARRQAEAAAHAYRVRAGQQYSPDREQVERLAAIARNILAAVTGVTTQLDGASAQMRAVGDAFSAELTKLVGPPAALHSPAASLPQPAPPPHVGVQHVPRQAYP